MDSPGLVGTVAKFNNSGSVYHFTSMRLTQGYCTAIALDGVKLSVIANLIALEAFLLSTDARRVILQMQAKAYVPWLCLLLLFTGLCSSARSQAPVPDSPGVEARVSEMLGKLNYR
jgi:hypothetical protein